MNLEDQNRLNMAIVNNDFCKTPESLAATIGITNFSNIVDTIGTSIQVVISLNELGDSPTTGVTLNVGNSRRLMMESTYKLANATFSYAASPLVKDLDLQTKSRIPISLLEDLSKEKCLEKCRSIYTLANANAANILPFGCSLADLTNANSLNDIYFSKIDDSQAARNIRKNAKKQATTNLNDIVLDQIGKQLVSAANTLRFSNQNWWNQFNQTLQIINLSEGTTRIKYRILIGTNPVNAAKSSIINKKVVKVPHAKTYPDVFSNPEGIVIHDHLGTALFDISILANSCLPKTLSDNDVKLGQSLDLGDIQLSPIIILRQKIKPGTFATGPMLPPNTPFPKPDSKVRITVDKPNAIIELWVAAQDDNTGNPDGYEKMVITKLQPYEATVQDSGFSPDYPKLMGRNVGTATGEYTIELTIYL